MEWISKQVEIESDHEWENSFESIEKTTDVSKQIKRCVNWSIVMHDIPIQLKNKQKKFIFWIKDWSREIWFFYDLEPFSII